MLKGITMWIRHHVDKLRGFDFMIKQNTNFTTLTKVCEGLEPVYNKFIVDLKLTFVDSAKIESFFENKVPKMVSFLEFKGELAKYSKTLAESLKKDKTVTKLRICWSDLTPNEFKEISTIPASNDKIVDLDLSGNLFGEEGSKNLVESLKKNISIKRLNISYNNINVKGIRTICDFMKETPVIKALNIEGNDLSKSIEIIKKLITTNTCLKELNLSSCSLSDKEIKVLFEGVSKNKTLKKLILNDNKFKREGKI